MSRDSCTKSLRHQGGTVVDPSEIASIFNDYFASIYCNTSSDYPINFSDSPDNCFSRIDLQFDDLRKVLSKLPPKTSIDSDGLSYCLIKNGGPVLCSRLYQLFSLSLELSRIPSSWKTALISPIFKKGSKDCVSNYRPISVTSCCSRVLERVVARKIFEYLRIQNRILSSQHGFWAGRSTDTALVKFYDFVTENMDSSRVVDCIFFDFRKAFDTVPHDLLLSRLYSSGLRGPILSWIKDFVSFRAQRVRIGSSISGSLPVPSGVIQGSVLGPTLFTIFVNEIDKCLKHCNILKYADDMRIFLSSSKDALNICLLERRIQEDIDALVQWATESKMSFNLDKCFFVSFGRHNTSRSYSVCGSPLLYKNRYVDLGIKVDLPFSFKPHVDKVVSKAFAMLGLITKVFKNKNKRILLRLYKAFVRPQLEFSSVIWNPYTISSISNVERVQKRFCRMFPEVRSCSYRNQLVYLGLLSLETRRLRFQLITIFKMLRGMINIAFEDYFVIRKSHTTRGHNLRITPKFSQSNYRLNFFTVSAISIWNQLDQKDVDAESLSSFKRRILLFFNKKDIW